MIKGQVNSHEELYDHHQPNLHVEMAENANYIPHPKSDIAFQNIPQVNQQSSQPHLAKIGFSQSSHIPEENTENYTDYHSTPGLQKSPDFKAQEQQ